MNSYRAKKSPLARRIIGQTGTPCNVYLLHFSKPYKRAEHYVGMTERNVEVRAGEHHNGNGAAITAAARSAGITFTVTRVWEGVDKCVEFLVKARGGSRLLCPICSERAMGRGRYDETHLCE